MSFYSDLSGIPVIHGELTIPLSGIWHADVVLDIAPPAVAGPQILTLVDIKRMSRRGARKSKPAGGVARPGRPVLGWGLVSE